MPNTKILLVEDDGTIAVRLERLLRTWDYSVWAANSGEMALQLAARHQPVLALMDIRLNEGVGEMDGIETAQQLRAQFNIPSIYLTAYADDKILQRARQTEPYGYLVKPVQELTLRSTIDMALAKIQAITALHQRLTELQTLNTIIHSINRNWALKPMAQELLAASLPALAADGGWVYLFEETSAGQALHLTARCDPLAHWPGLPEDLPVKQVGPEMPDPLAAILELMQPPGQTASAAPALEVAGALVMAKEKFLGVLGVFCVPPGQFSPAQRQFLATIADHLGLAMANFLLTQEAAKLHLLRESDRLRAELIAKVSHELRTPLGIIVVAADTLLKHETALSAMAREFLNDINDESARLEKIVVNLLALSRQQSGQLQLLRRPVALDKLIRATVNIMQPQTTIHRLLVDLPEAPLLALVDAEQVEQVLRNLLTNAIKYAPHGGPITVRAYATPTEIVVAVKDQGLGIAAADQAHIFESFYRAEDAQALNIPGLGLGLPIVRGIVMAHEGRLWVESQLGQGSTFYFTLPVAPQPVSIDLGGANLVL